MNAYWINKTMICAGNTLEGAIEAARTATGLSCPVLTMDGYYRPLLDIELDMTIIQSDGSIGKIRELLNDMEAPGVLAQWG